VASQQVSVLNSHNTFPGVFGMSAELSLTRTASYVSTTSTPVEEKEEAQESNVSLAPSQNSLDDLEKQALAASVPTVGILEQFVGAKGRPAMTGYKASSILAKPKLETIKEAKTDIPNLVTSADLESQLLIQTHTSLAARFAHTHLRAGGLIGMGVGAVVGTGTLIGELAVFNILFGTEPMGGFLVAMVGVFGGVIGNFAGSSIQQSIEARQHATNIAQASCLTPNAANRR
jgi:hypothetical protein